jgi:inner membrane protein
MPTVFTHAAVGAGLAALAGQLHSPIVVGLSMALAVLPDLDVLGLYLGVPYGSFWGHRGFSHSFACSLLVGALAAAISFPFLALPWWWLAGYFFAVMASHGLLDGLTSGGHGMAYFAPLDNRRYFFPWRPIRVSYIGLHFFRHQTLQVLGSELLWVWLPLAILVVLRFLSKPPSA